MRFNLYCEEIVFVELTRYFLICLVRTGDDIVNTDQCWMCTETVILVKKSLAIDIPKFAFSFAEEPVFDVEYYESGDVCLAFLCSKRCFKKFLRERAHLGDLWDSGSESEWDTDYENEIDADHEHGQEAGSESE